jgi:hypothetical protein
MTDEPALNMTWVFNNSNVTPQWLTTVNGSALCLFFPDGTVNFNDYVTQVGNSTRGKHIPVDMILEAVECVTNAAALSMKRMPTKLDAGATHVSIMYSGESVVRKIDTEESDRIGRIVYQDTNNSTNDFEVQKPPVIRRNNAKKPVWNTWGN